MRTITFNELRKIKDSLPSGSMHRIADELGLHVDTVRNFFGGHNFKEGKSVGIRPCRAASRAPNEGKCRIWHPETPSEPEGFRAPGHKDQPPVPISFGRQQCKAM